MTSIFANSFERERRAQLQTAIQLANGVVPIDTKRAKTSATINRVASASKKSSSQSNTDVQVTVIERVDLFALKFMIENVTLLVPEERTKFLNYAMPLLNSDGAHRVGYRVPSYGYGRQYPDVVCLQGLSRRLRSTLAGRMYWDIDAQNAHPVVLLAIARENNWPRQCLHDYIERREEILASIPLERKLAKQLMLQQMYGGVVRNFLVDKLEEKVITGTIIEWIKKIPQFVFKYGAEVRNMSTMVADVYPEMVAAAAADGGAKKHKNQKARALSLLVQTRETDAVMTAIEFIQKRGWVLGVLMHDGFMVYRRDDEKLLINQGLLNGLKQTVLDKCRLAIDFEVKEFEPPFTRADAIAAMKTD